MIFNKTVSATLSICLFVLLILIMASATLIYEPLSQYSAIALVLIVVFYFISRAFYSYLRNDGVYKNNRNVSSDKKGEKYITKGESDAKKLFIVIWVIVILILISLALFLFLINNGFI